MNIFPKYFKAIHPTKGEAHYFDEDIANRYAGKKGKVEPVAAVHVFHTAAEKARFDADQQYFIDGIAFLELPVIITEKGSVLLRGLIERTGKVDAKRIVHMPIEEMDMSVRLFNLLRAAKLLTLLEILQLPGEEELKKFRNFGKKSSVEMRSLLDGFKLDYGMFLPYD